MALITVKEKTYCLLCAVADLAKSCEIASREQEKIIYFFGFLFIFTQNNM